MHQLIHYRGFAAIFVALISPSMSSAQDAQSLFSEYSNRIYQIRIIDQQSGKRTSLGSGFLIDQSGSLITNYHVVSDFANEPDRYRVEYVTHDKKSGPLVLVNIDVINDLALMRLKNPPDYFISLAPQLPAHGESIYSIGNPHDLGWTVIPGTYNGITTRSAYERIHFSGSVNPGMSGGPVLNSIGQAIGVNVATAGNQLSFLIPLNRLGNFIASYRKVNIDTDKIDDVVAEQLRVNQRAIIGEVIAAEWATTDFGEAIVPSEIANYIPCWGHSEDDPDILYKHATSSCDSEEQIYLSNKFTTGNIAYQFNWLESTQLNSFQFYNMYKEKISNAYPDNEAGEEDVTEFACHEQFVSGQSLSNRPTVTKATFCVREYKKYGDLFDVLFFSASVHEKTRALISHFTIAGVEAPLATAFLNKFMSSIQWK